MSIEGTGHHVERRFGTGAVALLAGLFLAAFQASIDQQRVWQAEGVRAAAKLTGGFRMMLPPPETELQGLEVLVRNSDEIVVAKVESMEAFVAGNGRNIYTRYRLAVEEAFKGQLNRLDVFHLQIPGGKVVFPDGTWAEFTLANRRGSRTAAPELFREPVKGERFVVFGKRLSGFVGPPPPAVEPVLSWTASAQSLLEIRATGVVTSRGPRGPFTESIEGTSVEELARRVKSMRDY
jgi:hypothetical protein